MPLLRRIDKRPSGLFPSRGSSELELLCCPKILAEFLSNEIPILSSEIYP
jgi:hypothetical protein